MSFSQGSLQRSDGGRCTMGSWEDVVIECDMLWIGGFMGEGDVGKNQSDVELWVGAVNLIPCSSVVSMGCRILCMWLVGKPCLIRLVVAMKGVSLHEMWLWTMTSK